MSTTLEKNAVLQKMPQSPEPLYRLLFGRPMTEILLAAIDLGIFEALAGAPATLEALGNHLELPLHSAAMLLNACVALGLLTKEETRFKNSSLAEEFLVKGRPFHLGGLIEHFRMDVYPAWDHLKEAVQQSAPQVQNHPGESQADIFEITKESNRHTELFIDAMHNLSVSDGLVLAEGFDFSGYKRLLDIGGGSGALSMAVASRNPSLQAIVFDRPQVCSIAETYIHKTGIADRVRVRGGDVFKAPLPDGVDVILLSLFIHAFGLDRCTPLLKKCFRALPPGGCLLIYEPMLQADRTGPLTTLLSSLNMLVLTPSGGDVTPGDYSRWLESLGFESVFYKPLPSVRHLVGGFKPKA